MEEAMIKKLLYVIRLSFVEKRAGYNVYKSTMIGRYLSHLLYTQDNLLEW